MLKPELLAPAGDIEAGYAALYYGADAVYLGLQKFSARATATNFNEQNLNEFTAYAHHLGKKVYAAINTVVEEDELSELIESLDICSSCRVDAVIIQDLGVARVIRESYPELEMHASTQMAVHNKEGAQFLKSLGFSRVVVARELTLPEIKEIASVKDLEIEAFIHGALCYCYSGLCQFSALESGRSANRGKCLYPCRSEFKTSNGKEHIFSMKDMALTKDILKMPVASLKIEGRKKSALYVAAVTDYYRRILDGKNPDINLEENIKQIFSRPWCKFHFNGKDKNVTDKDFIGHRGLLIGKIANCSKGWISFKTNHEIGRFDGLQIDVRGLEKPFGFSVQDMKSAGRKVIIANKGEYIDVKLPADYPFLSKGADVYLASSSKVKGMYDYKKPKPQEFINTCDIDVVVDVKNDKVTAQSGKYTSEISGNFAKADNAEKISEAFKGSFNKTGGTALKLNKLTVNNPQELFVPVSEINKLRRSLYEQIEVLHKKGVLPQVDKANSSSFRGWMVKIDDTDYIKALNVADFSEIIYLVNPKTNIEQIRELPKEKVRISLPTVCRNPQVFAKLIKEAVEEGYNKWEVGNYWAIEMLKPYNVDISFDTPLYMFNSEAVQEAKSMRASKISFALEDTLENIEKLSIISPLETVFVVYQDVPLFTSAVCIRDNDCADCTRKKKWLELNKDGKKYDALSEECQIMLFDKRPLCLAMEAKQVNCNFYRADFCHKKYSLPQIKQVLDKIMQFQDIENPLKGNINNQKI